MNKWNRADWTLAVVAAFFAVCLTLKLHYPELTAVRMLFFCAEAALVGGVADWFAVTALFDKPLGFPYHTAIIPRRREFLITACANMVKSEFFSPKKLIARLREYDLAAELLSWLTEPQQQAQISGFLKRSLQQRLAVLDCEQLSEQLEREIKTALRSLPTDKLYAQAEEWFKSSHQNEKILSLLLTQGRRQVDNAVIKELAIYHLNRYIEEKSKDFFAKMMIELAKSSNVLNVEEAADILNDRAAKLLAELENRDSQLHSWALVQIDGVLARLRQDKTWLDFLHNWQLQLCDELQLREALIQALQKIVTELSNSCVSETEKSLDSLIDAELAGFEQRLLKDAVAYKAINDYLFELAGKTILLAQTMIGELSYNILEKLDDKELNRLIYVRVEQDLIWIRMNGSIVGAAVGLIIFIFLEAAARLA